MQIEVITFSKPKDDYMAEAEGEYLKRLKSTMPIKITLLSQSKLKDKAAVLADEAKTLLSHLKSNAYLIILDEYGTEMTSQQFAKLIESHRLKSTPDLTFAIGGPYGWGDEVRKRANATFSLSKLTFPAHVARFLLIEQLYRAESILSGHPYHK